MMPGLSCPNVKVSAPPATDLDGEVGQWGGSPAHDLRQATPAAADTQQFLRDLGTENV